MERIDFSEVKKLFKEYKNKFLPTFSNIQKDLVDEMDNCIQDLCDVSDEIVNTINILFAGEALIPNESDEIELMGFKIKLKRADPNVPIKLDNATRAFSRSLSISSSSEETKKSERKLMRATFEFYRIAHRISHITESLPSLDGFKAKDIRIIRNHLIEHPEKKDSGVTYDSFSYSKNEGPYVKGLRIGQKTNHMDKGFKINNEEFVSELERALKGILNP